MAGVLLKRGSWAMETDPVGHTDERQLERTRRLCEHTPRNTATASKHREQRGRKERPLEPAHTSSLTTDPQNREKKLLLLSAPPSLWWSSQQPRDTNTACRGLQQRAELWLNAGKGWARTKARGAAACVHLGNSGRDVSLAEPGFLPRLLPSLAPRGICFLPKGTNVHRLQTGAVHLPEPAHASVVLGPCFLKTLDLLPALKTRS